jgi:hypothetical protein
VMMPVEWPLSGRVREISGFILDGPLVAHPPYMVDCCYRSLVACARCAAEPVPPERRFLAASGVGCVTRKQRKDQDLDRRNAYLCIRTSLLKSS